MVMLPEPLGLIPSLVKDSRWFQILIFLTDTLMVTHPILGVKSMKDMEDYDYQMQMQMELLVAIQYGFLGFDCLVELHLMKELMSGSDLSIVILVQDVDEKAEMILSVYV